LAEMYLDLLSTFGFDEMQVWIASISALLFSANFLGGVVSALMFVNSRQIEKRPRNERISFRMFCFSELIMLIFIFFYHVFMIEMILVEHMIYWFSAILMMPLLAVIASETIYVTFSGKIAEKEKKLKIKKAHERKARKEQRGQADDAQPAQRKASAGKASAAGKGRRPNPARR